MVRHRRQSTITRVHVGATVDKRVRDELVELVEWGIVPNISEGVERGLRMLTSIHRADLDSAKREPEPANAA